MVERRVPGVHLFELAAIGACHHVKARPAAADMICRVVINFAATTGLCRMECRVAQIFTFLVRAAIADIMVTDSSERPQ